MKLLLRMLCLLTLTTSALGITLGRRVEFTPPKGWGIGATSPSPLPTMKFKPLDGRNAELLVTLVPNDGGKVCDEASLRRFHNAICALQPEGTATPGVTSFSITNGLGVYTTFVDSSLIGEPPKRDDFKTASVTAIWLRPDVLLHATMFADSLKHDLPEQLQILQSAKVIGPAPVPPKRRLAPQTPATSGVPEAPLRVPSGFALARSRENPACFRYINEAGVNLSGWIDAKQNYSDFRSFWAREKKSLEKGTGTKVEREQMKRVGKWDTVSYIDRLGSLVQRHLRACRVEGNTWADLHLSTIEAAGQSADLESILLMVEFGESL